MVEYQKYMFDNFVVKINKEKNIESDILSKQPENDGINNYETSEENQSDVTNELDTDSFSLEYYDNSKDDFASNTQQKSDNVSSIETANEANTEEFNDVPVSESKTQVNYETETVKIAPEIIELTYSETELKEAIRQAEEVAYNKGFKTASGDLSEKQNQLLSDIKNQLMTIYAEIENKKSEIESSSLKFALGVIRKVLPTLEQERAEAEVKRFLTDNFVNFAAQESLSFSFNPETVPLVAESIGRLAEQNDFEGKIAVHKDASLGVSDCRVEWKSGGVERNTEKTLDKIEDLIENN